MDIMFFIFPVVVALSLMFLRLTHPLSMGLVLLFQTGLVCICSGLTSVSFWFSYILFLVFLGGMLVLFIYVASLASNESFKFSLGGSLLLIISLIGAPLLVLVDSLGFSLGVKISLPEVITVSETWVVSGIYSTTTMSLTLYVVVYLLLTLFAVVEITGKSHGPLRLMT